MITIPLFFYETKCALLDDDYRFIDELSHHLNDFSIKNDVFEDYQFLNKKLSEEFEEIEKFLNYVSFEEKEYEIHTLNFDLVRFKDEFSRFSFLNNISVIFCDYEMPAINGLEFFEQINNTYVKKVLITVLSHLLTCRGKSFIF